MLLEYYRSNKPKSFSHYLNLSIQERARYFDTMQSLPPVIDILTYCLMPNHFHLLLRQNRESGIVRTVSNITNGYAKYFNSKYHRIGPLFQGPFKAVLIETEEQLVHVSRYIHLNPIISGAIDEKELFVYPWSSLPKYIGNSQSKWIETKTVLNNFPNQKAYQSFIRDQVSYGKELDKIKHLLMEEV
ncbi:hypothetical protein A2Z33_05765 [Candidatus Gottesmanbacteria bacterium RBG_16_52_11]|uniref:Transposase IS200-like domain-containing protein n=1 Tax=Candidatus Gottesmanbacteria bacterium RBG_16_52_11 TaxID=1798374 RepID=A0A1F5YX79_9BACT|nr:MAG: hypothetical protein A2Z33_05765 [Candidatus Gottesmanbacteria bacterium RBG_16_52_11]